MKYHLHSHTHTNTYTMFEIIKYDLYKIVFFSQLWGITKKGTSRGTHTQ